MNTINRYNIFENYKLNDKNIYLSYKGPVDMHILGVISDYIKKIIGKNPKVSRKLYPIFVELAQNISYYSAEANKLIESRESGIGTIIIAEYDEHYSFISGNAIKNENIVPLLQKCEIINSLDRKELREYRNIERKRPFGVNDGAHIGLIQVALTSNNPLEVEVTPISEDKSFFSIAVSINK